MENELSSDQLRDLIKRLLWEAKNKFNMPQDIILENETRELFRWNAVYSLGGLKLTIYADYSFEEYVMYEFQIDSSEDKSDAAAIYVSNELNHNNMTVQNVYLHNENRREEASVKQANLWFLELKKNKNLTGTDDSDSEPEKSEKETR